MSYVVTDDNYGSHDKETTVFTSSLGMGSRRDKGHTALSFDHIQDSGRGGELHGEDAL